MFSFSEELKWYEPGLETIEESLSGDPQKDLIDLMQMLIRTKIDPLSETEAMKEAGEGTQLAIEDALAAPEEDEAAAEAVSEEESEPEPDEQAEDEE